MCYHGVRTGEEKPLKMEDKKMTYLINIYKNGAEDTLEFDNLKDAKENYLNMCYYYGHDNVTVTDENGVDIEI